jgi:hypothetical protein
MKLEIKPEHFVEIIKRSYSLDAVYILKLIELEYDIEEMCNNSAKLASLRLTLRRKGLITDDDKPTDIGKELLEFLNSKAVKFVRKKQPIADFTTWWETYPSTDIFTHKGVTFKGTRTLRINKDKCREEFNKIINSELYTAKQIIEATEFDVKNKKDISAQSRTNKLSYMQNSLTYLNQKTFAVYIEMAQKAILEEASEEPQGSVDI